MCGGYSSAWLERQIVDLEVEGSNPFTHPRIFAPVAQGIERQPPELGVGRSNRLRRARHNAPPSRKNQDSAGRWSIILPHRAKLRLRA